MQDGRRIDKKKEAHRLKIKERRATTEQIAKENQFIMLDASSLDLVLREFLKKTQMAIQSCTLGPPEERSEERRVGKECQP